MSYEDTLLEIGLNRWETRAYVALLELGSTTTGPLAKKSNVPLSKIYPVLESLNKKGLVSYVIRGKTKYFQAVDPEILKTMIKEKEKRIYETISQFKLIINKSHRNQKVEIFEGLNSIIRIIINLIEGSKKEDEWLSFSIGEDEITEKGIVFWDKVGVARYEKGLTTRLLDNESYKKRIRDNYKDRWKYLSNIMRFTKTLFPTTTIIFQNKIIILNLLSEPETGIVIESDDLFKFYKNFFNQHWNLAKK